MSLLLGTIGPVVALLILLRRTRARDLGLVICLSAACGFGIGISSLVWWLLIQLPVESASTLVYLDTGIWAAVVLALAVRLPRTPRVQPSPGSVTPRRLTRGVTGALAVLLPIGGLAAAAFASLSYVVPHGEWDAWAIWNVRARVLFLGLPAPGADTTFRPLLPHPDYPELLPGSIARAWTFAGVDDVSVPIALAAMFASCVVLVAGASVRHHTTTTLGLLTAAFILASPDLVTWASAQFADVPLSFYVLLTFVFAASAMTTKGAHSLWAFAGLSAGLGAWTKNEGILFVIVVALIIAIWASRSARGTPRWTPPVAFAAGAAPALLVLALFKLNIEPANDLVSALSLDRVVATFTWDRIARVGEAMGRELWYGGATTIGVLPVLVLFVAVSGVPGRRLPAARLTFLILAIMLFTYAVVYVQTPHDLPWHLRTSLDRVLLQLMPSIVWAGMLLAGRRSEAPMFRPAITADERPSRQ